MREMMLVAAGGSLGALARWGIGVAAAQWLGKAFPWGTLAVNVVGCLIMGIVMELLLDLEARDAAEMTPAIQAQIAFWHKGVALGFLGALTTFSSFGADTLRDLHAGQQLVALANVAANVVLSLTAVWAGIALMRAMD